MSFVNTIKKAFGFGTDDVAEEWYDDTNQSESASFASVSQASGQVGVDPNVINVIFERVVDVFNSAMPDFIQKSADPDKQRQYLYEALDVSTKQYLESLRLSVEQAMQTRWDSDKMQMRQQMEALEKKAEQLEERKTEIKDRQLSAERQKRALAERVHDLEDQVASLEADKEQYQLEAQSLLNKMKASAVRETDMEALQAEIDRLKTEQENAVPADVKKLEQENEELKAEMHKINEAIEAAKVKNQMCDQMVNEMRTKVAQKEEELKSYKAQVEQQMAQRDEATEEEKQRIMEQLNLFEGVKAKMNKRIEELKENLKKSQNEIESLRRTIEKNLLQQEHQEKALLAQIAELKAQAPAELPANVVEVANDEELADGDFDELLSGEDWLVSKPAKESSMRSQAEDTDFGYQAPVKKHRTEDNASQMSLFDF